MSVWVMVIWMYASGNYQTSLAVAEFSSEKNCNDAVAALSHEGRFYVMKAKCVRK